MVRFEVQTLDVTWELFDAMLIHIFSWLQLKLRNQVTTEQEKLLGEKNKEMEEIRKDLEATKTQLRNKEDEVGS